MAERKKSFWDTVPGLITGIAAIVTGLAALIPIALKVTSHSSHAGSTPAATQSASPGASASTGSSPGAGESPGAGAFGGPGSTESPSGASGSLTANPTKADWGRVGLGSSPQQRTVTFTNSGSDPVTISGDVTIAGPNANAFSITSTSCANGSAIAPGSSCQVVITYTPQGGIQTATLAIPSQGSSLKVPLSATGSLL